MSRLHSVPSPRPTLVLLGGVALWALLLWPFQARLHAAISVVQTVGCRGDNVICTWAATPSASNIIVAAAFIGSEANTLSIDDISATESTLIGPVNSAANSGRMYVFCWQADATDADFQLTSSAVNNGTAAAVELSGATCTADGTAGVVDDTNGSPYAESVTTGVAGSFLIGLTHSTSVSNFSASGSTTGIGDGQNNTTADINGGDNVGFGLGGYITCGAPGSCQLDWTSAAGEQDMMVAAAVQAAAAASCPKTLALLGVGC